MQVGGIRTTVHMRPGCSRGHNMDYEYWFNHKDEPKPLTEYVEYPPVTMDSSVLGTVYTMISMLVLPDRFQENFFGNVNRYDPNAWDTQYLPGMLKLEINDHDIWFNGVQQQHVDELKESTNSLFYKLHKYISAVVPAGPFIRKGFQPSQIRAWKFAFRIVIATNGN